MATQPIATTQSRHIPLRSPYATVNQPAKKDGAGGAFTWGGVADVKDFELLGTQRAPTVTTRPATGFTSSITIPVGSGNVVGTPKAGTPLNLNSFYQFPAMGVGTSQAPVTWGPGVGQPRRVVSAKSVVGPTTSAVQVPASRAGPVISTQSRGPTLTQAFQSPALVYTTQSVGTPTAGWTFVNAQSPIASSGVVEATAVQQQSPTKAPEAEKKEDRKDATEKPKKGKSKDEKDGNCSIQ